MSIKDILEKQKKPIILGAVGVVLIIVLIIVFVPFGGGGKKSRPQTITKKAKINLPTETPAATQTAKVEQSPAAAPAGKEAAGAKPVVTPAPSEVKPADKKLAAPEAKSSVPAAEASKKPAVSTVEAVKKTTTPAVKPATQATEAVKEPKAEKKPAIAKAPAIETPAPSKVAAAEKKPEQPVMPVVKTEPKKITKRWAVNTVSVAYSEEAEGFAKKLKAAGYNTYITKFKKDDIDWFRVRVGFYGREAEARKVEKAISVKFKIDTPWAVKTSLKEAESHTK